MPSKLSRQVARIRSDIQNLIDSGAHDRLALVSLLRRIAPLVAEALRDSEHPIQEELENLRTTIQNIELTREQSQRGQDESSSHASKTKTSGRQSLPLDFGARNICFVPQPGANHRELRQHWRTQLLLLVGMADACFVERLAQRMNEEASDLRHAAQQGYEATTHHWDRATYLQRLQQAISLLDSTAAPVRLEGRTLRQGDNHVRLSAQECQLFICLSESSGEWIEPAQLQRAGVNNPVKIKHQLTKKLAADEIPLTVLEDAGRYMLTDSNVQVATQSSSRLRRPAATQPRRRAQRRRPRNTSRSPGLVD